VNETLAVVSYELYILEDRGWMLHARFPRQERDVALQEARHLESCLNTGVKVLRETYFPSTNSCLEDVVYCTPKYAKVAQSGNNSAALGDRRSSATEFPRASNRPPSPGKRGAPNQQQAAEAESLISTAAKLIIIMAIALTGGGLAASIAGVILSNLARLGLVHGDISSLTFGTFLIVFALTAFPMASSYIKLDHPPSQPKAPRRRRPPTLKPPPNRRSAPLRQEGDGMAAAEDLPEEDPEAQQEEEGQSTPSQTREKSRVDALRFLSGALSLLKEERPQLDKSSRFAIHLFLAGAMELMGDHRGLEPSARREILLDIVTTFGTKPEMAAIFVDRYEDYLMLPTNLEMVRAGRAAMDHFLSGPEIDAFGDLPTALANWSNPEQSPAQQTPAAVTTVIFTDMVGSTDLTQSIGDDMAQEAVRRHNTIVRNALRDFQGREIKHTGDGIMASFASASHAIDASIQIQQQIAQHNAKRPDLPLWLRIGMNAGEPIQEENDLFGTTVQLAARVCAQATAQQIFCSGVIHDLSAGKAVQFEPRGSFPLKGFREPVPIYEILWR